MISLQRTAHWSTAILVVLAGWFAAQATWKTVALFNPVALPSPSAGAEKAVSTDGGATYDLDTIAGTPLFGEKSADQPDVAQIKHTRLKIRLLGVIAGGSRNGVAILHHDGEGRAYTVGDRLDVQENVTLEAVLANHVIINRGGSREKIELERQAGVRGAGEGVRVVGDGGETVDLNSPEIRKLVGDPRKTLKKSPLRLTRFLQLSPHTRDGNTIGLSVEPGRDERLFGKLGLEPGDVVVSINGQPVADVNVNDLINSVDTRDTFDVVVLRNGQPETIRLSL